MTELQLEKRVGKQAWLRLAKNHSASVRPWTESFRNRRRVGQSHPVNDFLFVYYKYSPAKLERWHPGIDCLLESDQLGNFDKDSYSYRNSVVFCDLEKLDPGQFKDLVWIAGLLRRTASRPGNYSCLGMHEWAMVYQGEEIRHERTTDLRLDQSEIDAFIESRPLCCSHYDAFRFFADAAKPKNRFQPSMESRLEFEQPGCIHTNMDLYKWAFNSMPWVGSGILLECFNLAIRARAIDMRASPYELSKYESLDPIKIETPAGRAEYERLQRSISQDAALLRRGLATKIERVIELSDPLQGNAAEPGN